MKDTGKKEAEGRRIVADIFLHKERAERKEAESFSEMMVGAPGPAAADTALNAATVSWAALALAHREHMARITTADWVAEDQQHKHLFSDQKLTATQNAANAAKISKAAYYQTAMQR